MQGHLRLILLPIVYNAMAAKESLWKLPLFIALQQAMRASTYNKLLRHPSAEPVTPKQNDQRARCCCHCRILLLQARLASCICGSFQVCIFHAVDRGASTAIQRPLSQFAFSGMAAII